MQANRTGPPLEFEYEEQRYTTNLQPINNLLVSMKWKNHDDGKFEKMVNATKND